MRYQDKPLETSIVERSVRSWEWDGLDEIVDSYLDDCIEDEYLDDFGTEVDDEDYD